MTQLLKNVGIVMKMCGVAATLTRLQWRCRYGMMSLPPNDGGKRVSEANPLDRFVRPAFTLYRADCMDVLNEIEPVDCVVTSPPYNLNKRASGGGSSKMNYAGWYFDDMPERSYQGWQRMVVDALLQKCEGSIFYNHRIRYAWHNRNKFRVPSNVYHPMQWLQDFPIWAEIIWDRRGTTGHANGRCRLSDERIYQIGKPKVFHDLGYTTVWQMPPTKNEGHVCSYPEELVRRCIEMTTDPGDTVFDPFTGSGTTGVVAIKMGRKFIGAELDSRYFDLAKDRLLAAESDLAT